MKLIIFLLILFISKTLYSQGKTTRDYDKYIFKADSCYYIKDYKNSHLFFSLAFQANKDIAYVKDRYNAACSWALDNKLDSAFIQLYRIAEKGSFSGYEAINLDKDLADLRNDLRWLPLLNIIKSNSLRKQ